MTHRVGPPVLAALLTAAAAGVSGQTPDLALSVRDGAPRLAVGQVLQDATLEEALRSGLPLRMRFRVELWRDRFFDQLVEHAGWTTVIGFEPLAARFLLRLSEQDTTRSFTSYSAVRELVEREHRPPLRPRAPGRYYYLATLEIETLSLSDLEELGQWLRGELGPAVGGDRSVAGALGRGVRRALIRVLDLPARRYHARSGAFVIN